MIISHKTLITQIKKQNKKSFTPLKFLNKNYTLAQFGTQFQKKNYSPLASP